MPGQPAPLRAHFRSVHGVAIAIAGLAAASCDSPVAEHVHGTLDNTAVYSIVREHLEGGPAGL